jgi:hypothetical protein
LQQFNIRDFETYVNFNNSAYSEGEFNFDLIMSCLNNGLVFFQFSKNLTDDTIEFRLTSTYSISDIGRIYTEKAYRLQKDTFFMFVATQSPPIVYQIGIDNTLNVYKHRSYNTN